MSCELLISSRYTLAGETGQFFMLNSKEFIEERLDKKEGEERSCTVVLNVRVFVFFLFCFNSNMLEMLICLCLYQ